MKVNNLILSEVPPTTSVDELFSTAVVLGKNMVLCCQELSKEMETCRNRDTGQIFEELADRETTHIHSIREQAKKAGAKTDAEVNNIWLEQNLRGAQAREIADNPYLMTPYRALQLAVANNERVFEILSTLASNQDDPTVTLHAETLAREQLSEIAALRLRRRHASRSEIKTAVVKTNLDTAPEEIENLGRVIQTVHAIIRTMIIVIRRTWASDMMDRTDRVLQGLLEDFHDFPEGVVGDEDRVALETRVNKENDNLFSALKSLMRELESAVDLFLGYAQSANSEDIVLAAQAKAERYVHRIAKIRDELNQRALK